LENPVPKYLLTQFATTYSKTIVKFFAGFMQHNNLHLITEQFSRKSEMLPCYRNADLILNFILKTKYFEETALY